MFLYYVIQINYRIGFIYDFAQYYIIGQQNILYSGTWHSRTD